MSGNEEIYQILLEIKERLGHIDGKLEGLTNTLNAHTEKLRALEEDVDDLKAWKKGVATLAGAVAFVISLIVTLVASVLGR